MGLSLIAGSGENLNVLKTPVDSRVHKKRMGDKDSADELEYLSYQLELQQITFRSSRSGQIVRYFLRF